MERYDFLLTYEIKNREVENLCLVKQELERRGYTVKMQQQYDTFFDVPEPVDAAVAVIPAYYRPRAMFYTASHLKQTRKIVNLRWEQVLSRANSCRTDNLAAIKTWGYDAVHLAWGAAAVRDMTDNYHVPADHVKLTGHVALDFLRPQLRAYYQNREELFKQYGVPLDKEISLFISSFSLGTMHDKVLKNAEPSKGALSAVLQLRDVMIESQRIILDWFDQLLADDSRVLIYRPHPEEKGSPLLEKMQNKHPNFLVIRERSVKQWILTVDRILNNISTSVAEVYAAGKTCMFLQPLELPRETSMQLFDHLTVIRTQEQFLSRMHARDAAFPIPQEDMEQYYYIPREKMTFELICDVLDEVYHDDAYLLKSPMDNPLAGFLNKERLKNQIKRIVAQSYICQYLHDKDLLHGSKVRENIDDILYVKDKLARNHVSDEEIDNIVMRISDSLKQYRTI